MGNCLAPCFIAKRRQRQKNGRSLAAVQRELFDAIAQCRDSSALEHALEHVLRHIEDERPRREDSAPFIQRNNTMIEALSKIKELPGRIGLDIGGTLAKMVFLQGEGEECLLAERFGKSGRRHADLSFLLPGGRKLHFVSGETDRLRRALEENATEARSPGHRRKIVVSGGGAHRFADAFKALLNVEFLPFQEMESLVKGLEFLHDNAPVGEAFTFDENEKETICGWPDVFYPSLLVNVGSGVSILRIDGRGKNKDGKLFTRLGGTACGGATFLGLMQLVADVSSFEQAMELVGRGDTTKVNTLVQDIYGTNGCANLGLPPTMNAAYFGKLIGLKGHVWDNTAKEDLAAALMVMVVQESVVLARAFSLLVEAEFGRPPPVFFVGGFLAGNVFAQQIICRTFRRLKLRPALFLRHADFLGSLGSLSHCVGLDLQQD
mmetsp:Transcript_121956/g.352282  ORF Transcript_121956/g.352282 Transcript_121956/m.352282 type:complete len:435 (-) Transcript_121956:191-1495(-)